MKTELIISIILLALVLIDAIGDAFRFRGWLTPHHITEVVHVAGWIVLWAFFPFSLVYVWLYLCSRIVLFDITFNLTAGLPIGHIGKSSLYDIVLTKFGGWVRQNPVHFAFILRAIALTFWVGLFVKTIR